MMKRLFIIGFVAALVFGALVQPGSAIRTEVTAKKISIIYTGDAMGNASPCG